MRARTQITWTWLCTRGKKLYKYCSFSHTNRSFRVLGHQCVVTMGNCLIWISRCMFFFPLIETVTYTCHYMTDRLERFDLKTSKLDLLKKKRHLHLGCPWGKLIDTNFNFKVNYPFKKTLFKTLRLFKDPRTPWSITEITEQLLSLSYVYLISSDDGSIIRIFVQINILERRAGYVA